MLLRLLLTLTLAAAAFPQPANPERFARSIDAFLEQDRAAPPPREAILFIGSSIFRQWSQLTAHMAPLPVFNRAFGGSQTHDILHYMNRIVLPYEPALIVYYCGSNDINAGASAEAIAANYRAFVERVHARLPKTRIFYASINRAPQKRDKWPIVDAANAAVAAYSRTDPRLGFIDLNPALFDAAGQPRLELYKKDLLHFEPPAYDAFSAIVRPVIEAAWKAR